MTIDPLIDELRDRVTVDGSAHEIALDRQQIEGDTVKGHTKALALQLYSELHAGKAIAPSSDSDYINDHDLEERILAATPIQWRDKDVEVIRPSKDPAGLVVADQGLKIFVPDTRVVRRRGDSEATIRLSAVEMRLSTGFLFYTSRCGAGDMTAPLRLYRYANSADEVIPVWTELVRRTDDRQVPLRAKVLSRTHEYPRRDALVVYLPAEAREHLDAIVDLLAEGAGPHARVSRFAKEIGPGVGAAWEPRDVTIGRRQISFGEHRSEALAEGIVDSLVNHAGSINPITERLRASNIDTAHVYRNLDSPGII